MGHVEGFASGYSAGATQAITESMYEAMAPDYAAPTRQLEVGAVADRVQYALRELTLLNEYKSELSVMPYVAPAVRVPSTIMPETIVPDMGTALVPEYAQVRALYNSVPGVFSPAPVSILGLGTGGLGTLVIKLGTRAIASIAMDMAASHLMERVGSKVDRAVTMRLDTNRGEGLGRHMNIRGRDGATPGDQGDTYDEPDNNWLWGYA